MNTQKINVGNFSIANNLPFVLIAGPCQMESREHAFEMVEAIQRITKKLGINFIYKTSFDKANRTSIGGKRGIGITKALDVFAEIKQKYSCPILTDIHNESQCEILAPFVDILQIPAFLCRQTDLLLAAGQTGKIVNIKKGQFLAPWDVKPIIEKVKSTNNNNILLTDRGSCFGYNTLVSDMRGLNIMAETGYPVIFDATHSVQQPSGLGGASGGERKFVPILARAACAVGVAGVFIETHQDPDNAPSDGPCMWRLDQLEQLLVNLQAIDNITKNNQNNFV